MGVPSPKPIGGAGVPRLLILGAAALSALVAALVLLPRGAAPGAAGPTAGLAVPAGAGGLAVVPDSERRLETANWDINWSDALTASLNDGVGAINFEYEIGAGRVASSEILAKGCDPETTVAALVPQDPTRIPNVDGDPNHDLYIARFSFLQGQLLSSNAWTPPSAENGRQGTLEFCHRLILKQVVPEGEAGAGEYEISEDIRDTTIIVDLTADFLFVQPLRKEECQLCDEPPYEHLGCNAIAPIPATDADKDFMAETFEEALRQRLEQEFVDSPYQFYVTVDNWRDPLPHQCPIVVQCPEPTTSPTTSPTPSPTTSPTPPAPTTSPTPPPPTTSPTPPPPTTSPTPPPPTTSPTTPPPTTSPTTPPPTPSPTTPPPTSSPTCSPATPPPTVSGCRATFCDYSNGGGRCCTLGSGRHDIGPFTSNGCPYNDQLSYVKIEGSPECSVHGYRDGGFGGDSWQLIGTGINTPSTGFADNQWSSAIVGCAVNNVVTSADCPAPPTPPATPSPTTSSPTPSPTRETCRDPPSCRDLAECPNIETECPFDRNLACPFPFEEVPASDGLRFLTEFQPEPERYLSEEHCAGDEHYVSFNITVVNPEPICCDILDGTNEDFPNLSAVGDTSRRRKLCRSVPVVPFVARLITPPPPYDPCAPSPPGEEPEEPVVSLVATINAIVQQRIEEGDAPNGTQLLDEIEEGCPIHAACPCCPGCPAPPPPPLFLTVNASDFIDAFQCDDPTSFTLLQEDLAPGAELRLCIRVTSNSFRVTTLDFMTIYQNDVSLNVVDQGDSITYKSITTREYVTDQNDERKIYVSTRVPSNLFDFADGNIITVSGSVLTALQRRLKAAAGSSSRALQVADDEGGFRLELTLVDPNPTKPQVGEDPSKPTVLGKSAATASQGIIVMGVIFTAVFAFFL